MKWVRKGHEYDGLSAELSTKWKTSQKIYIFGAGTIGTYHKRILQKFGVFSGFIDNNHEKWSDEICGLNDFVNNHDSGWIILCARNDYVAEMKAQLESLAFDETRFFVYDAKPFFETVFPVLAVYELGKVFDNLCQISLTERCTLKCEKCAHGCWNVPMDHQDLDFNDVIASADYYFSAFDYVVEFVLIGGEPLLYKNLAESIAYIGEHYRDMIITFAITTNGTIVPSEKVIAACKKYDVHIHISNYVKTLPSLKSKYDEICSVLDANDISYDLSNEDDMWVDYGFDSLERSDDEDLCVVFDACKTPCREVRRNKYYYCVQARAVGENMFSGAGEKDFLDLSSLKGNEGKRVLLEFGMGYSEKGYLDMCKFCYGAEAVNRIIPRAIQKRV